MTPLPPERWEETIPDTVGQAIRWAADLIRRSQLCLLTGHQTPREEAAWLVCHLLELPPEEAARWSKRPLPPSLRPLLAEMMRQRILARRPAAYLTHTAYFAGWRFYVDERVLIPRSRIENLFDDPTGFADFVAPAAVQRILDLCTGSGCLAVALAKHFPTARVTATDLSADALAVAARNVRHHRLGRRVRLLQSDLFAQLAGERFDLIVTNPPYVPQATWQALPPEYHQEPALALLGGADGLSLVEPLLRQAADHLGEAGVLICEVGDEVEEHMMQRWPDFPGLWIPFHFGASGVFVLDRAALLGWLPRQRPRKKGGAPAAR